MPEKTVSLYRLDLTGRVSWRHLDDEQIVRRFIFRMAVRAGLAIAVVQASVCEFIDIPITRTGFVL